MLLILKCIIKHIGLVQMYYILNDSMPDIKVYLYTNICSFNFLWPGLLSSLGSHYHIWFHVLSLDKQVFKTSTEEFFSNLAAITSLGS